ncbi:MAG: hypothetical protein AAGB93_24720, partial [Planctomycetota bacterium]
MALLQRSLAPLLAALCSVALLTLAAARPGGQEQTPGAEDVLRIATIGASVTAGYGNARELRTSADAPLSVF